MRATTLTRRRPTDATESYDAVVVGGGIAGMFTALSSPERSRILMVCDGPLLASTSYHAQGGIAAALGADDSPALHADDTMRAGDGLCCPSAVAVLTSEAPERVRDLIELGVVFDDGLGLEGAHSRRRIVHAGGAATGERVARALAERVLADPQIDVAENERASCAWIADGRCVGLVTERRAIAARATILATGGMAALWEPSTNPLGTTGAGIAIAYKAGAALADIEFTQFHPTALAGSGFLLSEALRGEGALLLDAAGERFTDELAGRDVLARAIAAKGIAMLDLRPVNRTRFPTLMDALTERGHNPSEAPIEVAPAAHYTVGGIVTDLDGHSEIPGLYAVGECACTGAHGANRLASNSLLECLVFGRRAAAAAADEPELPMAMSRPPAACGAPVVSSPLRKQLWDDAGPVRDRAGLTRLAGSSHLLARLVAQSALTRVESRGAHFRTDFPHRRESLARHIVVRAGSSPVFEEWR